MRRRSSLSHEAEEITGATESTILQELGHHDVSLRLAGIVIARLCGKPAGFPVYSHRQAVSKILFQASGEGDWRLMDSERDQLVAAERASLRAG